jgi:outer membrane protein OmpA-like peptidoglycan-associated protein
MEEKPDSADSGRKPASLSGTQVAALPEPPPAEKLDGGQLYRIPFGSASSEISDDGKKYLDELAQRMKDESSLRLQLLGYAGSTQDSASKARRTSLFRALSVRTYLMKLGVRSTRMDVRALGNLVESGAPDRVDAVLQK